MLRVRMAAGAAYCFVALFSGQALASGGAQCWRPYEVEAARVRDLHIMLMLGTLKCKTINAEISDKYNEFLDKKSSLLGAYNNILKTRFIRLNGIADGQQAYEEFNTRLGNGHSGGAQTRSYCEITDTLLTLATDARDQELPQLARQFSESRMGIDDICDASVAAAPVIADTAEPATVVVAKADEPTAEAEAESTVAVAKAEAPPASPPSAAAALEAAAAALQTAAASLKAQPAAPAVTETADKAAAEPTPKAKPAVLQPSADDAPVS